MVDDLDAQKQDEWIKQFFPKQDKQIDEWAEDACFGAGFSSVGCQIQDTDIHWAHWLNLKEWTNEQAASLICGFEPNRNISNTTIVEIIQKIDSDLKLDRAPPFEWLRWFDKVGLLGVSGKLTTWYNEQLAEKKLAGDLPLDDSLVLSVSDLSLPQQGRREKQLEAILGVIEQLGLAPMKIPDGKKTKIESVCREQDKPYQLLFGDDGSTCFENAWKVGRKQKLFKMENNDSYAKRDK